VTGRVNTVKIGGVVKAVNDSQQAFLDMTAKAVGKARLCAKEADKLGLMTLAREWDYFSTSFAKALERQLRVFEIEEPQMTNTPHTPEPPPSQPIKQLRFT
jgi:hypothetical protein